MVVALDDDGEVPDHGDAVGAQELPRLGSRTADPADQLSVGGVVNEKLVRRLGGREEPVAVAGAVPDRRRVDVVRFPALGEEALGDGDRPFPGRRLHRPRTILALAENQGGPQPGSGPQQPPPGITTGQT